MTRLDRQGEAMSVERLCTVAGLSRASYYRWLAKLSAREDADLLDHIQRLALQRRFEDIGASPAACGDDRKDRRPPFKAGYRIA